MLSARNRFVAALAAAILSLSLTACNLQSKATPKNFITRPQRPLLDHPDCLFPDAPTFPLETTDPAKTKQTQRPGRRQAPRRPRSSTANQRQAATQPTEAGTRVRPRFCYGHAASSPPSTALLRPRRPTVSPKPRSPITYTMDNVPVWAQVRRHARRLPRHGPQHQRNRIRQSHPRRNHGRLAGSRLGLRRPIASRRQETG